MIDFEVMEQQEFASITALNLGAYLRKTGWEYQGKRGQNAHIFTLMAQGRKNTIAVPVFEPLDDHAERISDAIEIICRAENRSALAVFLDLAKADNDSVRVASTNGAGYAPLTISNSADFLEAAHDLMSYSARAAEDAKFHIFRGAFRGGASAQVSSFLNSLAFSPDFLRGYRLTMYSPVPVRLDESDAQTPDTDETPFAREATQTLARALFATSDALSTAIESQSSGHFRDAIEKGVSANLCDALSRLAKGGKGVSIDINWSLLRASRTPPPSVTITYQHADILQSAAATLRTAEPSHEEFVLAHVIQLARGPRDFDGRATLLALRDGRNTRMSAHFNQDDYATVIDAFESQIPLSLIGDVYRSAGRLEVRNPHGLRLSTG